MAGRRVPPGIWWRLVVVGCGHVVMLGLMHILLETFEPNPNGFRFDSVLKLASFSGATVGPAAVGAFATSQRAVVIVAAIQAASPLLLIDIMRNPADDLNFAILLWWYPLPILAAVVVIVDHLITQRRLPDRPQLPNE